MAYLIFVLFIVLAFSARWNWWRPNKSGLAVLMYHKIGRPPEGSKLAKLWVTPEKFRKQMEYLKKNGYEVLTFAKIAQILKEGKHLSPKSAVITFDDGYKNNINAAMDIAGEFGFPCVIFVVSSGIGGDNFWHNPASETRIEMLSEDDIKKLLRSGVEIGSHTLTHKNLSKIDIEQARVEIIQSKAELERMFNISVKSFAYPYGGGALIKELQQTIKNAGYSFAVSIKQGKSDVASEPYCLKRIFVRGGDNMLDFHLNMVKGKSRF